MIRLIPAKSSDLRASKKSRHLRLLAYPQSRIKEGSFWGLQFSTCATPEILWGHVILFVRILLPKQWTHPVNTAPSTCRLTSFCKKALSTHPTTQQRKRPSRPGRQPTLNKAPPPTLPARARPLRSRMTCLRRAPCSCHVAPSR
jgi:hypothetical protein